MATDIIARGIASSVGEQFGNIKGVRVQNGNYQYTLDGSHWTTISGGGGGVAGVQMVVLTTGQELPTTGEVDTLYFKPRVLEESVVYEIYFYNSGWQVVGGADTSLFITEEALTIRKVDVRPEVGDAGVVYSHQGVLSRYRDSSNTYPDDSVLPAPYPSEGWDISTIEVEGMSATFAYFNSLTSLKIPINKSTIWARVNYFYEDSHEDQEIIEMVWDGSTFTSGTATLGNNVRFNPDTLSFEPAEGGGTMVYILLDPALVGFEVLEITGLPPGEGFESGWENVDFFTEHNQQVLDWCVRTVQTPTEHNGLPGIQGGQSGQGYIPSERFHFTADEHERLQHSKVIFSQTASKEVICDGSAHSLIGEGVGSVIIPARTLKKGEVISFIADGTLTLESGASTTLSVKFNDTVIYTQTIPINTALDNTPYNNFGDLVVRSVGETSEIVLSGVRSIFASQGFGTSTSLLMRGSATIDTTIDNEIKVEYTAPSGASITSEILAISRKQVEGIWT